MSGPVEVEDVPETEESQPPALTPSVLVSESRLATVGSLPVRRALPNRGRRTVGAWCFTDHFGPVVVDEHRRTDIGPHPHMGLQTVTWLLEGELLHRDSLESEQVIRAGQLNLMTAGHGVAHAEETVSGYRGRAHGVQLWVAQPSSTRHGRPAFEHHPELPHVELENGDATVLVGELDGSGSPARRDTEHMGADLALRPGTTTVPVDPTYEYALVVTTGVVSVQSHVVTPGQLAYLGAGRDELGFWTDARSRVLLLGGTPFPEKVLMWWNFVARTRGEIEAGYEDWTVDSARFGRVNSPLPRIEASRPVWMH